MNTRKNQTKRFVKKIVAFLLVITLLFGSESFLGVVSNETDAYAATTLITSMEYFNMENDGPTQTKQGTTDASFGFVMPQFNGKTSQELSLEDVEGDLQLYVKQAKGTNGEWKKISDVDYFVFNETWGWEHQVWSPTADGWICWFKLTETTQIRFQSKTNSNVTLEYTMNFEKLPTYQLTSISVSPQETDIKADSTGGSATHWNYYTFNNDPSIKYDQIKDDMTILVDNHDGKGFVNLLGNASSGFLWDKNFGIYTEGNGGLWFTGISWSFTLRFQKKGDKSIYADVNVTYEEPVRNNWKLEAFEGTTTFDAVNDEHTASVGIVLPTIGGTNAVKSDIDLMKYEVCVGATYNNGTWTGGKWILLNDVADSGWIYQGNGLNQFSKSQQWGYFVDTVYGLWFQPVKKNTYIRIGYPENGKAGGEINNNYVYYTLLGDPDAIVPSTPDMTNIKVEDSENSYTPSGWSMIWNDEFNGTTLDTTKWTPETGYLLEPDDINTAGWGNNELEHYTNSSENIKVSNGALNITMKKEPKVFTESDDSTKKATALYSSGKLVTKNNFSFKYGRVDIRAKMPAGDGIWPALWMLPNDNIYGAWACSGEIDIFEGRGRIPNTVFGTLHYGAEWPSNLNTSDAFDMVENGVKGTDFSDWHVYSVVWEEDSIKIYCDGICFFKCTNDIWYSGTDRGNKNAPFDQRFYLIMNLAAGGSFDNYVVPGSDFTEANMYVDYVRVFQRNVSAAADEKPDTIPNKTTNGVNDNLFGDYKLGTNSSGSTPIVDPTTNAGSNNETTAGPGNATTPSGSGNATTPSGSDKVTTTVKSGETKVQKPKKAKIKKVNAKKKSAKKIKLSLKKINGAEGYQIAVYKTKKNAKKNKKALIKKIVKKRKVTIKSNKLKNKKKLFVRARAYVSNAKGKKVYGKWSNIKKVKIKK